MKLFKVFVGFWILVALIFGTSLFFPRYFKVERSVVVNKPVYETFAYLNNIKNIAKLSPWDRNVDSTLHTFFSQDLEGLNAAYYFHGQLVGQGSLRISESVPEQRIATLLDINNHDMTATSVLHFEDLGNNHTRLMWRSEKDLGYNPIYRFMAPTKTKETETAFDEGLMQIKLAVENSR